MRPTSMKGTDFQNSKKLSPEIANCANKILVKYLKSSNKLDEITNSVYAMERAKAR